MSKFIAKTVDVFFLAFSVLMLICLALSGGRIIFADSKYLALAAVLLFGCLLFGLFGSSVLRFLRNNVVSPIKNAPTWTLAVFIGVVTLLTKLFLVLLFDNDANLHPDMQRYLSFANQIARDGEISEYVWYAYRHKRTAIFGMILAPFAKLFGGDTQALTAGLTLGVAIASVLLFDIVRKRTGNTVAFLGVMIYNLMPFGLLQTQLLVHETALLFFHILSLWLLLKASEEKHPTWLKILLLVLSGLSIAIGKSINPAGSVIIIAFLVFSFVRIVKEKITVKGLMRVICLALVLLIAVSLGQTLLTKSVSAMIPEDDSFKSISEKKVTLGWTIYLAFNYEQHGVWNQQDYETYYAYEQIEDVEAAREYQINLVKDRLNEYKENPVKIPVLFCKKFYALWGDLWMTLSYEQGNHIEHFVFTGMSNLIYAGLYLATVCCLMIALICIVLAWKKRKYEDSDRLTSPALHFKMVVIGTTVALLFSEVMSKYTSHLHILIFAVWMYELRDFESNSAALKKKIFKKGKRLENR